MAKDANDLLYQTVQAHPDRFAGSRRCRRPIRRPRRRNSTQRDQAGFKGTMIHGHTQGEFLDDKKFWPIFECAEALDVPIYLHPTVPHPT